MKYLIAELYSALKSDGRGLAMVQVLKNAKARGVTRIEAEQAVSSLLDRLPDPPRVDGVTSDADLTTEILMLTQNYCRPEFRIWPDE